MKKMNLNWFYLLMILLIVSCGDPIITDRSYALSNNASNLPDVIGINWKITRATNLATSSAKNWDSLQISDPKVIKTGYNEYHMWYSGLGPDLIGNVWQIGYAFSRDGINWVKGLKNPVIIVDSNGKDKDGVRICSVMYDKEEKIFKLWYRGFCAVDNNRNNCSVELFYASSLRVGDGWKKHPNSPHNSDGVSNNLSPLPIFKIASQGVSYDNSFIGSAAVIKRHYFVDNFENTYYYLWYTTNHFTNFNQIFPVVRSVTSDEDVSFKEDNSADIFYFDKYKEAFYNKGYMMPTVILDYYKNRAYYKMWFVNYNDEKKPLQAGLAYGSGGNMFIPYDEVGKTPLFSSGVISEDSTNISALWVIRDETKYKMWYSGTDNNGNNTICYKESN